MRSKDSPRRIIRISVWLRLALYTLGGLAGAAIGGLVFLSRQSGSMGLSTVVLYAVVGLIFTFLGLPVVVRELNRFDDFVKNADFRDLIAGVVGLLAGLVLAALVSLFVRELPAGGLISALVAVIFGWVGARVGLTRSDEMAALLGTPRTADLSRRHVVAAIVDTSVAIDGRVGRLLRTGFIDFPLIVPGAVLSELQYLADSGDQGRRNRGRRGFDTLDDIQGLPGTTVEFLSQEPPAGPQRVDDALLALAKRNGWAILTKDYNLARVARLEGLTVLNLHDLSRALQPSAVPGEDLTVTVVKEGKEPSQGLAYLEDGTMVVIENGRSHLSREIQVTVTTVRQTAAGRLVFAVPSAGGAATG